jgi:vancomycin resistance protein YoaR
MRIAIGFLLLLGSLSIAGAFPEPAEAALPTLTYRHTHLLFTIGPKDMASWQSEGEQWMYRGQPVVPPAELRVDGDSVPALPEGFEKGVRTDWDPEAIVQTISQRIAPQIEREPGKVTIRRNASGSIMFDGAGFQGRKIDMEKVAMLTIEALESGVADITLPMIISQPELDVQDAELREKGIKEFVTMGESDFTHSTQNRIHNVRVGLDRFNGHLIEQGETFSFVETLGPVDGSTGYLKELTIIGDKTVPDYGGGLCQVSSTAYRGVWEYGFPILQRKNHSYAVSYYGPQGTDATIYPPNVDIKFLNDSPGALLMQTVIDVPNTKAYFLYYGTRDDRQTEVVGPFTWGFKAAPPPRTEYTNDLPAGARRKVGEPVRGLSAAWFRTVKKGGQEKTEGTYSVYQARPLYYQVGGAAPSAGTGSLSDAPAGETMISD